MTEFNTIAIIDVAGLAGEALAQFEKRTHTDERTFWCLVDGSPVWMRDLCHDAHGDMMPNDHRYSFIVEALTALAEDDEDGDSIEADSYTADLTGWIHSRTDRYAYCDQAVEEGYGFTDTVTLLSLGQLMEKREVFQLVKESLEARIDDLDQ